MPTSNDQPGFGGFVRRHDRLLSVLGTIVVAATFMIREGYRENLKDLSSSIEGAENQYAIRDDHQQIVNRLRSLELSMKFYHGGLSSEQDAAEFALSEETVSLEEAGYNATLANLETLAQKLSTSQTLLPCIKKAREDAKVNDKLPEPRDFEALKGMFTKSATLLASRLSQLAYSTVYKSVQKCYTEIITAADAERTDAERSFKRWTKISYFLYAFGTLLTLIGKVYKVEGLDAGGG